jgi:hypothetical protein
MAIARRYRDELRQLHEFRRRAIQDGGGGVCNYQWAFGFVNSHQGDSENTGRDELSASRGLRRAVRADRRSNAYRLVGQETSNQSGGWTMAVDSNGDGQSILRLDSGTNYQDISTYPGSFTGVGWAADACGAAGVNQGGCSDSYTGIGYNTDLEKEHLPESNFFDYLITVEKFPLDQLRFQASYVAFMPYQGGGGLTEADPYIWAGYSRGRNGTAGCLNDAEMGRSFGRPLRIVSRAAWAMPDTYSSDRDYFKGIINGNLACIATYMDYLDSRTDVNGRGWGSAPYLAVGLGPATPSSDTWQRRRGNSIVSTTAGNPTVFTVKGDDSGAGSGIDDHGMLTGDYVDIAGIATSGATALNGDHRGPITKISATQFSLAINTTASTSGEGTWTTRTGGYFAHWRAAISGWETYWICSSGLWTCSSTALAFPDRLALAVVSMQTCSSYSTAPGPLHNFYPIPGHTRGDNYALYATCAAWQAANEYNSSTGDLFLSQAAYTGSPHRGNDQWNPAAPNDYYTPYATALLAAAADRGVSGAATAYSTIVSATGVLNGLKLRPGFYWGAP